MTHHSPAGALAATEPEATEPHLTHFRELGVSDAVSAVLEEQGILNPFPVQTAVIPEALRGGDVLAKSPTGSGKTLAFAIPIVERIDRDVHGIVALVLVPTRELASQVTPMAAALSIFHDTTTSNSGCKFKSSCKGYSPSHGLCVKSTALNVPRYP